MRADPASSGRSGFSLLETLVVLAIMALSTAVVLPQGAAMLDRMSAHAVFLEFQGHVSDLRREAYRRQTVVRVDPGLASARLSPDRIVRPLAGRSRTGDDLRRIGLSDPWSYTMDRPLEISEGGVCTPVRVQLWRRDTPVVSLRSTDRLCHFERLS